MLLTQKQLSLSTNKVLKFVCTVIRTLKFYAWNIFIIEGIALFSLRMFAGYNFDFSTSGFYLVE